MTTDVALADELRNLERFASCDREVADEAFTRLSDRVERFLWRYLVSLVPLEQEREDVIQAVLQKLYVHRLEFQVRGVGAWWSYVAITARRCVYDRSPQSKNVDLADHIPDQDLEVIGRVAELSHYRSLLYRSADELWLGIPRALPETERRRRLLAAQLFYLHSSSWQEIISILGGGDTISRSTLDGWFLDQSVILDLAYSHLYLDNESLVCTILGSEKPLTRREFEEIAKETEPMSTPPLDGWTWDEIKIAIWRYRNGLLTEKIQQIGRHLTEEAIDGAIAKCRSRLPFERRARELQRALARRKVPTDLLASPGLWKRQVFQYAISHELPQKQVLERVEASAAVTGFNLTEGMLSAWLSNGRLLAQLASHVQVEKQ